MNMPAFTAEASLYKTSEYYQFAAEWINNSNDKAIIPQIPWWVPNCRWTCDYLPHGIHCYWKCVYD